MASTETILIGTAGYSYPGPPPKGWYSAFYPDRKPKGFDKLKYYSSIFNTVEINFTFYRPASQAMTKNWAAKTPSDFSFVSPSFIFGGVAFQIHIIDATAML